MDSFRLPRPIVSLLASSQLQDVKRGMYGYNSADKISNAHRFKSLLKSAHSAYAHKSQNIPQCLGSGNSAEFLSYDTTCSNAITPSEYCCQVYAEQACPDPRLTLQQQRALVNERTSDFNGLSDPFHYDTCMAQTCATACSAAEGSAAECKQCSNVCQRSCLANMVLLCLRRTCGQSIMSVAEKAIARRPGSPNMALEERTTDIVSSKLGILKENVRAVENSEIMDFALGTMQRDPTVPLCSDNALISADVAAGVIVDPSGTTYAASLISCTNKILNPKSLKAILADPNILQKSDECTAVASCERNHVKIALDRAGFQVTAIDAMRSQVSQGSY